jgi:uncharacterized coiled-coil protein SlyX
MKHMKYPVYLLTALLTTMKLAAESKTLEQRFQDLENKVQKQEMQIKTLMHENTTLKKNMESKHVRAIKEELFDLADRMDDVEMNSFTDKIKFQLGFQTRVDNYTKKMANGSSFDDNMILTTWLKLDMFSNIAHNLKFNGRLSMYKYWADSNRNTFSDRDFAQGRRPGDSALYVERAYVDWTIFNNTVPLILTIGRQPSSDGPSHQFKNNTVRKSTYSALAFDGAVDGAVLTANFQPVTQLDNTAIRLVYGKAYQAHDNLAYSLQANYTGVNHQSMNGKSLKDTVIMGFFLDGTIPHINNTLVQLGYVEGHNFVANDANYANYSGMNINLGDFKIYGFMIEATNIKEIGLDLFAHYGISNGDSNGNVFLQAGKYVGMLQSDNDNNGILEENDGKGSAFWIGMRYALPFNPNNKLGYEYNQGDRYWYSFTGASNDLTNKLATRGNAHEIYYIHEINRYAHLRLGSTFINYDYTNSGNLLGGSYPIDTLPKVSQSDAVDQLRNYYLLFNILY